MARKTITDMSAWPSLSLEGNLIAPAMIAKIDQRQAPEQTPEDYAVRKGLQIREEIATAFRVGQSHFDAFAKIEHPSAATTTRFISGLFKETFGYDDLTAALAPIALSASGRVPMVVVPPQEQIDRRSPTLSTDRSRSPAFALQDYLNDSDDALWGIVTNGMQLRLMRDNASLTRPAYIEADLAQMFTNEDIASFAVLWLLIHRSRFGAAETPATDCPLERWRDAGSKEGEAARDRLAYQVKDALKLLGSGFLEANPDLAAKLQSGEVNLTAWFNELLRLVYRLIFLMVAEDRNLLHPDKAKPEARTLYAEGYSLQSLRKQCYRAATWDKHHDRYEGVKVVFHALTHGQPALALPALGGLFAEDRLPHLETATLRNRAFMEALYRLSWLADKNGMVPVNWRAMETEELGSVYESLLELQPQFGDDGKTLVFASEAAEQKGNQRKTTGSYYTPDSLVQALLDTALDPVLDKTEAEAGDPAKALLKLSVIDPACGSGHFLLAAARRIATRLARIRAEGTPSLADFRHALRDVARCCIHGVDRNPMAVELTKVALWIETVDPGLPLGFFDAQIRCGDALLGVFDLKVLQDGIPDAAYKPLTGDNKDTARYYLQANRAATLGQGGFDFGTGQASMPAMKPLALDFSGFRDLPEDTVEQIGAKAKRFKELRKEQTFVRAKAAADLYVAAFLLPKMGSAPAGASSRTVPTTEELWMALNQGKIRQAMMDAPKAARRARAFHWPLEFPDIIEQGGFDVVLGNPPWDTMSPDYKEFFSVYEPNIRHMSPEEQEEAYGRLLSNPVLAAQWEQHCSDLYAAVHFIKSSGRYRLFAEGNLGKGDFNVYRMFVETALAATRRGRVAAQFVPEGLYNGANATAIRRELLTAFRLEHLAGFENTKGIWFDKIDTRMKFCLYVAWKGGRTEQFNAAFRVNSSQKLQEFMTGGGLRIPVSVVEEFSPEAIAVMEFAAQSEIDICARMYALYPKFGADIEDLPHRHYMAEAHMGNNRELFTEGAEGLPVFEGRMIDAYDYRAKGYVSGRGRSAEWHDFPFGLAEKRIQPQWRIVEDRIPEKLGGRVYRYRIGFGDVASPTNQRALTAALIPPGVICGDKVPTIILSADPRDHLLWLGVANSIVMDFLVRKKVALKMSYTIMDSLPFPRDFARTPSAAAIASRVCSLCAVGDEMEEFRAQAVKAGILEAPDAIVEDPEQRAVVAAEIDVLVARDVFGQSKQEMLYILDPDNILGLDCGVETFKALRNAELREFKEFRTQRLIEEAWDRLERDGSATLGTAEAIFAAAHPIELPSLGQLPDAVWAWSQANNEHDRVRTQLRALVGILPEPSDVRRVRLAALACLQPALLDGFLSEEDRREWQRLVAHPSKVTQLVPPTNVAWGTAFNALVSSAVLDVSSDGTLWGAGKRLDRSTLNANDPAVGRALFAWSRLKGISLDQGLARVPAVILPFIREGRVAA
ncbi:Eco57I restriction-modification methylase domain-containing protein [Brucella pseudogrignonensis]|uniref:site-specific DNA-methyltransferase (adenine-specific) n=1 Tax=Brucella pseudogrignonensis TaxID=419475 RepID=A0A256G6F0_9HYPH|nr:N-6 DNA methylase [Brucella pseudogrignonensis]OYR22618.1 N-6 DNA Methylase family protein [Brucella pseudogrignonensis]